MMTKTEIRFVELRADDQGILRGVAVSYSDTTTIPGIGRERFMPGVFGPVEELDVILNRQHVRNAPLARTGGGGLVLTDGPDALRFEATMPDTEAARDTLTLVRKKILRGASIEFASTRERMVSGVRSIQAARLTGIGVVDRSAYPQSAVEARGENLVRVLESALPDEGDTERPARITAAAEAAGIAPETMMGILRAEIALPPRDRLVGFSEALDIPLDSLLAAAIEDGGGEDVYGREERAFRRRRLLWA